MSKKKAAVNEHQNFIEAYSLEEANTVDLSVYTLIKYDEKHSKYVFKLRAKRAGCE